MNVSIAAAALVVSVVSLYFAWRGHRRAIKADERAELAEQRADRLEKLATEAHKLAGEADERARAEERRQAIRFEFAHAESLGSQGLRLHVQHKGVEEANRPKFDDATLAGWEVTYKHELIFMSPGQSMYVQLLPNRYGRLPESLTVHWDGPFSGQQVVPLPPDVAQLVSSDD